MIDPDMGYGTYTYDANGNQPKRVVGGQTFALEYDAENRLVKACQDTSSNGICDTGETVIAQFTYDGDGRQVKAVVGSVTTYYVGAHYQVENGVVTKYYGVYGAHGATGTQRVATPALHRTHDLLSKSGASVRKYTIPQSMTIEYFLGDHLGCTSITTDNTGAKVSEMRYKPWGETRYTSGTTPTNYQYTGQRKDSYINLLGPRVNRIV